jgi:hypothetical protein
MTIRIAGRSLSSRSRRAVGTTLSGLCAIALAGCNVDDLLEVPDPDVVTEESIFRESALPVLHAGAIGDFQVAYSGFPSSNLDEGVVLLSGLMADEYDWADSYDTRREIDVRNVQTDNADAYGVFAKLQRARVAADRALLAFRQVAPDDGRMAELHNLVGYTLIFFGEMYCSGVPFSDPTTIPWRFGEPVPTNQIFEQAIARFDSALAVSSAPNFQLQLARVGKARALLNLNQPAQAAAEAAQVPTTFSYQLEHSDNTSSQNNGIWAALNNVKRYRVADREGGNGLPYRSAADPRVRVFQNGPAFDQNLIAFSQLKFPDRTSQVAPADGVEARLIEAEAALRAPANLARFVQLHNELRARVTGLAPFTLAQVTGLTEAARVNLHFQERAFWLWQTAHRLGDMRRLVRQYGRTPEQVFPTGAYFKGGSFGFDVNFPIPVEERNNPNFTGCVSRGA